MIAIGIISIVISYAIVIFYVSRQSALNAFLGIGEIFKFFGTSLLPSLYLLVAISGIYWLILLAKRKTSGKWLLGYLYNAILLVLITINNNLPLNLGGGFVAPRSFGYFMLHLLIDTAGVGFIPLSSFLFMLYFRRHPSKTDRIAELEKQVEQLKADK